MLAQRESRLGQVWFGWVLLGQVRLGQVRLGQVRLGIGQVRLGQVRLGQVRIVYVILRKIRLGLFTLGQSWFRPGQFRIISLIISRNASLVDSFERASRKYKYFKILCHFRNTHRQDPLICLSRFFNFRLVRFTHEKYSVCNILSHRPKVKVEEFGPGYVLESIL